MPARERVVEVSAFVAAPLAGMTLAGLGCEVLRVDPPGGGLDFGRWPVTPDGESLFWAGLNRGKRSVVVDFRRPEGRELVASMVVAGGAEGGVLLTNLGAGGALAHDRLRQVRADVVSIEVEGYPDGRSAVDYTIAARTGIPLVTGPRGHVGPVNSPLPTWDIATGLNAALATREALHRRALTGRGARVRIALSDVALGLLSSLGLVDEPRLAVEPRGRDGNYLYGAFGRDFLLADGARVMIVALTAKQWRALVSAMGAGDDIAALEKSRHLDFEREGERYLARYEIAELVERWCGARTSSEVADVLEAHGVAWAPYGTAPELATGTPGAGLVGELGLPFRFDDTGSPPLGRAPVLGQDTEQVLTELLGLSARERRSSARRRPRRRAGAEGRGRWWLTAPGSARTRCPRDRRGAWRPWCNPGGAPTWATPCRCCGTGPISRNWPGPKTSARTVIPAAPTRGPSASPDASPGAAA